MKLATIRCAACDAELKRSARSTWASCSRCSALVSAYLRATVGTRDPSAWVRACNRVFGSREAFCAVAAAERAA